MWEQEERSIGEEGWQRQEEKEEIERGGFFESGDTDIVYKKKIPILSDPHSTPCETATLV